MAINPLLPLIISAMQTRNIIKDTNEAEYDEVTGAFIDAAAAEFFKDKAAQKKRIENNEKLYKAAESNFGTNIAEFAAKNNLFEGYDTPAKFIADIRSGSVLPVEFRNKLKDDKFFNTQGFKTTFAEDTNLAKQQLEDKTLFAAKNLNKGAVSNLADLYLGDSTQKQSPLKTFLFGKKTPDITAAAAGFEKGLEDVEAKSVVPQDTAATSDAASLAADTNLIDKKLGFEQKLPIGSVRELDSAIAAVFNLQNVQITNEGIIFPEAYRLRALAIKDIASDLAQSGKYDTASGVDVATLVADAAALKEQKYFSTLPKAFGNYSVKSGIGEAVNATAEYSITPDSQASLGDNFITIFGSFADNPDTELVEELKASDLILKQDKATKVSRAANIQAASAKFVMTDNAYSAIENFIQSMENTALQKAYIQYLPKNLNIFVGDNAIPIQDRLNATFGFTTF
mgnify:FL=1